MEENKVIEINYEKPKMAHVFSAYFFDLFSLFVLTALFLVGGLFAVQNMHFYKEARMKREEIQLASRLYSQNESGDILLISDSILNDNNLTYKEKEVKLSSDIEYFYLIFLKEKLSMENGKEKLVAVLKNETLSDGTKLFDEEGKRIYLDSLYDENYVSAYKDVLTKNALGYLSYVEGYSESRKIMVLSNLGAIYISFSLAFFAVYLLFPCIFYRGRRTLGMKLSHIGYVCMDGFNPGKLKFAFSFLFKWILVFSASFMTLGIPLFISAGMFFLGKNHQTLTEYVFGFYAIKTDWGIIYLDYYEFQRNNPQ